MKYFAIYDESGELQSFGATSAPNVIGEITEAEYNALVQDAAAVNDYSFRVYSGEVKLEDVPEEYRERVEAQVAEMQEADNQPEPADPEVDEALAILRGEVTE